MPVHMQEMKGCYAGKERKSASPSLGSHLSKIGFQQSIVIISVREAELSFTAQITGRCQVVHEDRKTCSGYTGNFQARIRKEYH